MNTKKWIIFSIFLPLIFSFPAKLSIAAEPELGGGRISLIQGQVLIQTKDAEEWIEASVNFPITDGDRIMTERDGRVELNLKNGTYVRIGEESQLDIIALTFDRGKTLIHLNQLEGRVYVNHRPITEEASPLYIDLPYGVLSSYVPSRFRVDLTPSEVKIYVLEGSVEFQKDGRPIPLTQGKTLIAREGSNAEVAQLYGRDEWDRWNESRDNELFQRRHAREYLPPELESQGYEMEGNGQWVYTPEYQYVWVPTVVVGWAPFQHGYWAWRRGIYCWVPYEPWGWVPFHYGRWVHIHIHGWVWAPPFRHAVIWNPGAVAWHIMSTHVSWVPLAPGEIYYGHRHYGPHSVNINRVNINIQKNFYINAKIKNAVATVHRDSFFRRNPARINPVVNPFLNPVKVSGPPKEKPVFLEGKKTPSRFIKESIGKVHLENKPSPKEWRKDIPSTERDPKVIDQKRITQNPENRTINETVRNRVERIEQSNRSTDPAQGNEVKRELPPVPARERVRGENQAPNQEGTKNRNTPIVPSGVKMPNDKEPKYSQVAPEPNVSRDVNRDRSERTVPNHSNKEILERRNTPVSPTRERTRVESPNPVRESTQRNSSVDFNRNRYEKAGQPNAFQKNVERNQSSFPDREGTRAESPVSLQEGPRNRGMSTSSPAQIRPFSQPQEGRAFAGGRSLPEGRSSPVLESKGQIIPHNQGSRGGFSGSSLRGSFR